MPDTTKFAAQATAALAICESMLLALKERDVLSGKDVSDLLDDVLTAHSGPAASESQTPSAHVVVIIERIIASMGL